MEPKKKSETGKNAKKEFANEQEHWQAYYGDIWDDYNQLITEDLKAEFPEDFKDS